MIAQNDGGRRRKIEKKLALIDEYCKENKLPRKIKLQMRKKVKEYSEKSAYKYSDKEALLSELSIDLRLEIGNVSRGGAIRFFSLFLDRDERFIYTIIPLLMFSMYTKTQLIYSAGDITKDIYFIINGKVNLVSDDSLRFKILLRGHSFGDSEIFKSFNREYTAIAAEDCDVWIMNIELLKIIEQEFPTVYQIMENEAIAKDLKIMRELSEMRGISKARKDKINELSEIKKYVVQEYQNIIREHEKKYKPKNDISEIDVKLNSCKGAIFENNKILEDIEKLMKQIVSINK